MKRFCFQTFLFVQPMLLLIAVEVFLPVSTFTYRPWEALQFRNKLPYFGPFYPLANLKMASQGDLNHHSSNAIFREEQWITDEMGFRNDSFEPEPDILVIGDSFVAGARLDQKETLTCQLDAMINEGRTDSISIYNMAPSSLTLFDLYLRNGVMKKPKVLIYSKVERTGFLPISTSDNLNYADYHNGKIMRDISKKVVVDKLKRVYSLRWVGARILNRKGEGHLGKHSKSMFFRSTVPQKEKQLSEAISNVGMVEKYKRYCDSVGIDFLFVALPDKETVYYDYVPFPRQPDYLFQLDSILALRNIPTINALRIFNQERKKSGRPLYHDDDSHWNAHGVKCVAESIIRHSVTQKYLD